MCHVYVDMYNVGREYKHTGNYANRCAHMSCGFTSRRYTCEDDSDRSLIRAIFECLVVTLLVLVTYV